MSIYHYEVYGLGIESSIYFPELEPKKRNKDVHIHFDSGKSCFSNAPEKKSFGIFSKVLYGPKDAGYLHDRKPLFRVKNGKEIIVNSCTRLNKSLLRGMILNQAMGILFHQRGHLILHANAIDMAGGVVAFLGGQGVGKSTTTFSLINSGYSLVTDDVLTIDPLKNNIPHVIPSYPRIKLWGDVIKHSGNDSESIHKIHPNSDKYYYSLEDHFSPKPLPLKIIYVLGKGCKNEIISLNSQDATIELVRHLYSPWLISFSEQSRILLNCANIVKSVPIKRLNICHSLDDLENLVEIIKKDKK